MNPDPALLQRRALLGAIALGSLVPPRPAPAQPAATGTERVSVRQWGAAGKGDPGDTARIQAALDEAPIGCDLIFPAGTYQISRQLDVRRKMNLIGEGAILMGAFDDRADEDMLAINVTDDGNRDNRCQRIAGLRAAFTGGGRNLIRVGNQSPNIANMGMLIENCVLTAHQNSRGHCIRFDGVGTHFNTVRDCQLENGVYLACADGMTISGCSIFGHRPAVTLDLIEGAFQTRIIGNGLVARDGALHIRNASQVHFEHNQVEQFQAYGANRSKYGASVTIVPEDYPSRMIRLVANNFGGGTNLQTNIHAEGDVQDLAIDHNVFGPSGSGDDIRLASSAVRWTRIGPSNTVRGVASQRPRVDPGDPVSVADRGVGTFGVRKPAAAMQLADGWRGGPDFRFIKTMDNVVRFEGRLAGNGGDAIGRLPDGFRPRAPVMIVVASDRGPAMIEVAPDGALRLRAAVPTTTVDLGGAAFLCQGKSAYSPGI